MEAQTGPDVTRHLREIIERLQDNDDIVTPSSPTADILVLISWELRKLAYQLIQLNRNESQVTHPKCQLLKLMEIAGMCNIHSNDAGVLLRFLPYFYQ